MSRSIDVDNIDEDDARYLRDRPNLIAEAKLQGVHDIEQRIDDALGGPADVADHEGVVTTADVPKFDTEAQGYDSLTIPELKVELERRGRDKTGRSKTVLIERLAEDDAEAAATSKEATDAENGETDNTEDDESSESAEQ